MHWRALTQNYVQTKLRDFDFGVFSIKSLRKHTLPNQMGSILNSVFECSYLYRELRGNTQAQFIWWKRRKKVRRLFSWVWIKWQSWEIPMKCQPHALPMNFPLRSFRSARRFPFYWRWFVFCAHLLVNTQPQQWVSLSF